MPVPTDPYSAGLMAVSSIANSPPPSSNAQNTSSLAFDNSGFAVNIGTGTASSNKTALPTVGQAAQQAAAGLGGLLGNPLTVIVAAVALFLYLKHK